MARRKSSLNMYVGIALGLFLASTVFGGHKLLGSSAHGNVKGGTLSCGQLEALWEEAGGSSSSAFLAAEIAEAESSGEQYSTYNNTDGSTDRGYWQINSVHGSLSTYDAYGNARAAVIISNNGRDWTPWVTYNNGAEVGKC